MPASSSRPTTRRLPTGRSSVASSASSPLIGISSYLERTRFGVWDVPAAVLPHGYLDGVVAAGGVPVLLPPVGEWTADLLSRLDGLVIAGGADIDPSCYGADRRIGAVPARPGAGRGERRRARRGR